MTDSSDDIAPVSPDAAGNELPDLPAEVRLAAGLALERKARDVLAMDLRAISTATDHFLLATGNSDIQVKAIAEHVLDGMRKAGHKPNHVEGMQGGRWVLLDFVDYVIHVFHPAAREFYQLERLWGDAPLEAFEDGEPLAG